MRATLASCALLLLAATACRDAPTVTATSGAERPAIEAVRSTCNAVLVRRSIHGLEFRSVDDRCRVYLPDGLQTGVYPIESSSAGRDGVAAVELQRRDGTVLHASAGRIELTLVADGRVEGTIDAEDDNVPDTGHIRGVISAELPEARQARRDAGRRRGAERTIGPPANPGGRGGAAGAGRPGEGTAR